LVEEMPLHKRKPFSLLERPDDLKPDELVFQIRFTKEIFRNYCEYLNRINLYRQRVWTCKSTGKSNLTYEEALVSEKQANEKIQQFPKELMEPVLRDVQFSMLHLKELVSTIAARLQERLLEGSEIYGRKNNRIYPCKIVKVIDEKVEKTQYQVEWLDKDKKVTENAVVSGEDLIKKKLPFGRDVLKAFIKESTCRRSPWVLHDKLALKYGISTILPEELRSDVSPKRKLSKKDKEANNGERKRKKQKDDADKEDDVPIKYPIDDLKVKPAADDPVFTPRPPPTRNFNVPAECVGDALMVWDFCSSYSKLLNLSPFSLDDFENALCYKESNIVLIVESHAALLRLLIKDDGDYFIATQKKKRKLKITLMTWTDYLCDFLELTGNEELTTHMSTIKRGHYGLLDINAKLGIFCELIGQVLASDIMREKLDEFIEERHALVAKKRGEALEEGRKRREKKEMAKAESNGNEQNGDVGKKDKDKNSSAEQKDSPEISGKKQSSSAEQKDSPEIRTDERNSGEGNGEVVHTHKPFSCDHKQWGYYTTKPELDSLMGSLNEKGERERALKKQLEKRYNKISREMLKKSKEADRIQMEEEAALRRSSRVRAPPRENPARAFLNTIHRGLLFIGKKNCLFELRFMASDDGDQDARYTLSKLLQRGTLAEYDSEFLMLIKKVKEISESLLKSFYISGLKPALQCALLMSNPTTLSEAFLLARATKAHLGKDALSKLLQMGTVAEYQNEFEMLIKRVTRISESLLKSFYISGLKPALQIELLRERPTSLEEAYSLACITKARFEDERPTTTIAKTNDLNTELPGQDLEEMIRHKPNKVEVVKTSMVATSEELEQQEYQDDLNEIFVDTFGSNGEKLRNWKELDNESEDRKVEMDAKREGGPTILATFGSDRGITIWDPEIKSAFQDDTLRTRRFQRSGECYALGSG
nr:DDT domain-containing protein [Tanacetum cinerariifolium]